MEWIVEVEDIGELLDGRFTVQTKPLVRCKDCKHRYSAVSNMTIDGNETWRHECLINRIPIRLDWFCSDGERRTDG